MPRAKTDIDTASRKDDGSEEIVTLGNWTGPMYAAANLMDVDLLERLHALRWTWRGSQEFLDAYARLHEEEYGEEFIVN